MKKQIQRVNISLILLCTVLSSCVNLKSVNHFSAASLKSIKNFEEISYNFWQHCMDRCRFEAIQKFEIKRGLACNCVVYKKADKATLLIYNALRGYFDELTKISGNNLTDYNFNSVKESLTEGTFGDIQIEEEQVKAYSAISKILLKSTTDVYRKNKIRKYIGEANAPIQVLLSKFQFILQKNLEGELDFKKEKLYAYYQEMEMDNGLSTFEKSKAAMDYYQQLSDINIKQEQINAFVKNLTSISEGHQHLYDNRNKISAKELKELLSGYASNIREITSEFNKLQK